MEWSGQKEFVASPEVPFIVDDSEAGVLKNNGPLSFLKVSFSGSPTLSML
jgi:serine carboxypeptidase-like clade 4